MPGQQHSSRSSAARIERALEVLCRVETKLDAVIGKIEHLHQIGHHLMSQLSDLITEVNDATNVLAAKLDAMIAAGKITDPKDLADLTVVRDQLRAMGADSQNPVPAAPAFTG